MLVKIPDSILAKIWGRIPLSVQEWIKSRYWLAGGAIRDLINEEVPIDWDIFRTGLIKARQPIITKDGCKIDLITIPVPVLERFKEFDYRCCMLGITRTAKGELTGIMDPLAYDDTVQKRLVVNPGCVYYGKIVDRMEKFVSRGWKIDEDNRQRVMESKVRGKVRRNSETIRSRASPSDSYREERRIPEISPIDWNELLGPQGSESFYER